MDHITSDQSTWNHTTLIEIFFKITFYFLLIHFLLIFFYNFVFVFSSHYSSCADHTGTCFMASLGETEVQGFLPSH